MKKRNEFSVDRIVRSKSRGFSERTCNTCQCQIAGFSRTALESRLDVIDMKRRFLTVLRQHAIFTDLAGSCRTAPARLDGMRELICISDQKSVLLAISTTLTCRSTHKVLQLRVGLTRPMLQPCPAGQVVWRVEIPTRVVD